MGQAFLFSFALVFSLAIWSLSSLFEVWALGASLDEMSWFSNSLLQHNSIV